MNVIVGTSVCHRCHGVIDDDIVDIDMQESELVRAFAIVVMVCIGPSCLVPSMYTKVILSASSLATSRNSASKASFNTPPTT